MEEVIARLSDLPPTVGFFVLTAGISRFVGALFGLWGMYFILGPATVLRTTMALVVSAPMMVIQSDALIELAVNGSQFDIFTVPLREFVIGFALGLLMSLPFFAVLAAAMLIDQYSGDFAPGLQAPEGQTVGAYAMLNVVMVLFLFVEAGGFLILVKIVYDSFTLLPPAQPGFAFNPEFAPILGDILQSVMISLVFLALPIIVILMLLEFAINMLARVTEKVQIPAIDFLMKNITLAVLMPLLAIGLIRMMQAQFETAAEPLGLLQRLIGL